MIIAIDFDGTIVENRYPEIGHERPFAIETLKMLQQDRHRLVLWTCREGQLLEGLPRGDHRQQPALHAQAEGRYVHR